MEQVAKRPKTIEDNHRPLGLESSHLIFLDNIRDEGKVNMFGAAPLLVEAYGIGKDTARKILMHWMDTYGERHPLG